MRITDLHIKRFRSIKDATVKFNSISALVGVNNAGKTSILRAINAVLNFSYESESFINQRHRYAPKTNSYITITFEDIPHNALYSDKVFQQKLTLQFKYTYSTNKKQYRILKGYNYESVSEDFITQLQEDLIYVYIPAGRNNKDISWEGNSIFQRLITSYASRYTERKDRLSGRIRDVGSSIHDTVLKRIEADINSLYMQNYDANFKIKFSNDLDYTSILNHTNLYMNADNTDYLLSDWGSGTKSLAIIAMHRAYALQKQCSIVLGIEEPEMNLHPQSQKRFILSLRNDLHNNETQMIFTTHSTVIVDALYHDEIILVRRVDSSDRNRSFESKITQITSNFWADYALEKFKHYQFFNYKNSDFFFAKYVIVAESKNDCQVLQKIIEPVIMNKLPDISFLDLGGIEYLKYPYFLLKELEIPFLCVVDHDFFFGYKNGTLSQSRNPLTGFPEYDTELKNNDVINDLFPDTADKSALKTAHQNSYTQFFKFAANQNILPMRYCLEMDLVTSSQAAAKYYSLLNIMPVNQNQKHLLIKCKKSIKNADNILSVVNSIQPIAYPYSFKKIRSAIINCINNTIE